MRKLAAYNVRDFAAYGLSLLLVASVAIGTRLLLFKAPGTSEYGSFFLYAIDCVALVLVAVCYAKRSFGSFGREPKLALLFLAAGFVAVVYAPMRLYSVYSWLQLSLMVAVAFIIGAVTRSERWRGAVIKILAIIGVVESLIALAQFYLQRSIGLSFLGEQAVSVATKGAAKIIVGGIPLLRAYGTFPHPNMLGAFLAAALIILFYLWFREKRALLIGVSIPIAMSALLVTFSRAAWIVTAAGGLLFVCRFLVDRTKKNRAAALLLIVGASLVLQWLAFGPMVAARASLDAKEVSVVARVAYARVALDIIQKYPLGVGVGSQVMVGASEGLYKKYGLIADWQLQPAHSLYLLIAAETGVVGVAAFIGLLFYIFIKSSKQNGIEKWFLIILFLSFLALGLFDHFFWSFAQGRLMFWIVVGLMIGLFSPLSSMDRISPSEGGDAGSIPAEGTRTQ